MTMFGIFQIVTVTIVSVAMAASLTHALELPGKMRLGREEYLAVQRIYYPGFTVAGVSEPAGILAVLILLFLSSPSTPAFWLTFVALLGLVGMQIVFWLRVQPVNKVWLQGESLSQAGSRFFSLGKTSAHQGTEAPAWTALRNRWEYSHVARAALAMTSFIALLVRSSL
jgi:hypothetical protein